MTDGKLDLFEGFTSEEIRVLVSLGKNRGGNRRIGKTSEELRLLDLRLSEAARKRWASKSAEEMEDFSRTMSRAINNRPLEVRLEHARKSGEANKQIWAGKTLEERDAFSQAVKEAHWSNDAGRYSEICLKVSESIKKLWMEGRYGEERNRRVGEASRAWWSSLSFKEKERFSRERSEAQSEVWRSKSPEARARWVRNALDGQKRQPSKPERALEAYLDGKFPGRWIYNGDGSQGVVVGRRVPDFVRSDGSREVLEVFGAVGFRHYLGEEAVKISHYESFGYKCTVIWEWDCYLPSELDKLLGAIC